MEDGFGFTIPFGSGGTARKYQGYGVSGETYSFDSLLGNLAKSFTSAGGDYGDFNLGEGPQGPQGMAGPQGLPGITTILTIPGAPGLYGLDAPLETIPDVWASADTIVYSDSTTTYHRRDWEKISVEAATRLWYDADINDASSLIVLAASSGIHVSTDDGDSWTDYDPGTETYTQVSCGGTNSKIVALGGTGKATGKIWVSEDSGANWTEKTIS